MKRHKIKYRSTPHREGKTLRKRGEKRQQNKIKTPRLFKLHPETKVNSLRASFLIHALRFYNFPEFDPFLCMIIFLNLFSNENVNSLKDTMSSIKAKQSNHKLWKIGILIILPPSHQFV